jgi:hypothetical protein
MSSYVSVHPAETQLGSRQTDTWRSKFEFAQPIGWAMQDVHISMIRNDSRLPSVEHVFRIPLNAGREWYNWIRYWLWDWSRNN